MQSRLISRGVLTAVSALFLGACENPGGLATGGFRNDYMVARQALEAGDYGLAIRRYDAMIRTAGPLEPRLRLEYAHSLLRGNRFDDAAREAGTLVETQTGAAQGSALAVRGTARHEAARELLAGGQRDDTVKALLLQARSDLDSFLKNHPGMDVSDMMRERSRLLEADLRTVGA